MMILIRENLDGYLIPKNDEFFCEYTPSHNDRLNFISNFTGSYGFSLILRDKNYLFVDGRYTLQAKAQCGKYFKIITFPNKMPFQILKKKLIIGFDPKIFTKKTLNVFFSEKLLNLKPLNKNIIDEIWKRKIHKNKRQFFSLPRNAVDESYKSKIDKISFLIPKRTLQYSSINSILSCSNVFNILVTSLQKNH